VLTMNSTATTALCHLPLPPTLHSALNPEGVSDAASNGGHITARVLFWVEERIGHRAPPFYQQGTIVYTMHGARPCTMDSFGNPRLCHAWCSSCTMDSSI
jgi:hypothetical protein